MSETILSSFQDGLDSRRSNLTSSPHALEVATNVHINQGAEIEKRRAFVNFGAQAVTAFGLEVTSAGLVTFGSAATPALPNSVSYVRLQHPSDNTQVMTAIVCSCSFGGKSWAVARFVNGDVFIYYNGVVIPACVNGLVLIGAATNLAVATQLYNFVNTSYFSALGIFTAAPVANGLSYYVDIYGTPGVSFTLVPTIITSALGALGSLLISNGSQGTAFSQANFGFSMFMGVMGTLASVLVSTDNGATFGVSLLGVAIPWVAADTTGYATALNIAATISSSLTSLPITGKANNNQVTLLADPSLGATPNGYPVKLTTTGDFCLDEMLLDFSAVAPGALTSTSLLVGSLATAFSGQTYNGGGSFVYSAAAGTYFWHKGANDVSMAVAAGPTFYADNFFTIAGVTNITFTGVASASVTAQLTKMVEILGSVTTGTTPALLATNMATKIRTYCLANALNYTACASTANVKQLIVSRNLIVSTNQFLPVLGSDIVGVGGLVGTVIQTAPSIQCSFIPISIPIGVTNATIAGIINVSIVGGSLPYLATITPNAGQQNIPYTITMPDGNPSAITGSFSSALTSVGLIGNVFGVQSVNIQYTLTIKDSNLLTTSKTILVAATVNTLNQGQGILQGFGVTFL